MAFLQYFGRKTMRLPLLIVAALVTAATGFGIVTVFSESPTVAATEEKKPLKDEAGLEHKGLARLAGNWNIAGSFTDPATGKQITVTGDAAIESIFDGRFLYETNNVASAEMGGCQGRGFIGYSNADKAYQAMFISEKFTGMKVMDGQYNTDLKAIVFNGSKLNPKTGKALNVRVVVNIAEDDRHVIEFFSAEPKADNPDGASPPAAQPKAKETKEGELIYTRK